MDRETYKPGHEPQSLPGIWAKSPMRRPWRKSFSGLPWAQMLFLPLLEDAGITVLLSTPMKTCLPMILVSPLDWASFREMYSTVPFVGSGNCIVVSYGFCEDLETIRSGNQS